MILRSFIWIFLTVVGLVKSASAQYISNISDEFVKAINFNFTNQLSEVKSQTRYTYVDVDYDHVTIDTIVQLESDTLHFALSSIENYQWNNDTLNIIIESIELGRENRTYLSRFTFDEKGKLKSYNGPFRDLNIYRMETDSIVVADTLKYNKEIKKIRSKRIKYGENEYPSLVECEVAGSKYFDFLSSTGDTLIYNRMYESTTKGEYMPPSKDRAELKIVIRGTDDGYSYYDGYTDNGSVLFNSALYINEDQQLTKSKSYENGKVVGVNRMTYNDYGDQLSRAFTNNVKGESMIYQNSISNTVYIYDGKQEGSFVVGESMYNKLIIVHSN